MLWLDQYEHDSTLKGNGDNEEPDAAHEED